MAQALKIPSMNQVLSLAVTIVALFFVVKLLPLPENVKNLFRV